MKESALQKLISKAKRKVDESRVTEEMHNISGQIFMGAILPLVLRSVSGVVFIWILLFGLSLGSQGLFESGACAAEAGTGRISLCVFTSFSGGVFLLTSLGVLIGGSALAMYLAPKRKFQFSGIVTAGTLLSVIPYLLYRETSVGIALLTGCIIFLAMFWGYTLYCKRGHLS